MKKTFWDRTAQIYDRFMMKDLAAYQRMYALMAPVVRHKRVLERGKKARGFHRTANPFHAQHFLHVQQTKYYYLISSVSLDFAALDKDDLFPGKCIVIYVICICIGSADDCFANFHINCASARIKYIQLCSWRYAYIAGYPK